MVAFVNASQERTASHEPDKAIVEPSLRDAKRLLRQEESELRDARRRVREQRQSEDAVWQVLKTERQEQTASAHTPSERRAQDDHWRALRRQRQERLTRRKETDQAWRQERLDFRQRWSQLPIVTAWIAILVITDNCTRQCLGLPLFVAGPRVTSEMIVTALRTLLPPDLLFLITDRGTHFTADAFRTLMRGWFKIRLTLFIRQKFRFSRVTCQIAAEKCKPNRTGKMNHPLMRSEEFIHVLIARHRPQSNGIAERFVRSLKEWLRDKSWQDDQELAALLDQFVAEYNDRPHQGLHIPGLSPNEFTNRIWLF